MITREQYISSNGGMPAHRAYYGQFVNADLMQWVVKHIGQSRILSSTDPHLNDIPLREWDALHGMLAMWCKRAVCATTSGGYSLSDSVCIAKESARQFIKLNGGQS